MKEEIYNILKQIQNGELSIGDAQSQLLLLFDVSNNTVIETPLTYCPKCKSTDIRQYTKGADKCNNCNHAWDIYIPF